MLLCSARSCFGNIQRVSRIIKKAGRNPPFQTFVDELKDELKKNRELQENVKQVQGDVDKFQDSEAMKQARPAYKRARVS